MQLTVREAARLLKVPEKKIYHWIDEGTLPAYRVNEVYRLNRAELFQWATERKMTFSVESLAAKDESCPPSFPIRSVRGARVGKKGISCQ